MLDWIRNILWPDRPDYEQDVRALVAELNSEAGGGQPVAQKQYLGTLPLPSHTLVIADPQCIGSPLEISNIPSDEVSISAMVFTYPSGGTMIGSLELEFSNEAGVGERRRIGEIPIDSAMVLLADKKDIANHWSEVGKDRIGVISTAPDQKCLRKLKKRFKLETVQVNAVRAEVTHPVSEALEQEIEEYLESIPKYAQHPFLHFYVQTNNSFDRANFMEDTWAFLPVGNDECPLMLACSTGYGDGTYVAFGEFVGETPCRVLISFLDQDEPDE